MEFFGIKLQRRGNQDANTVKCMSNNMRDVSNDHWTCGIHSSIECDFAMDAGTFVVSITNGVSTLGFSIGRSDVNEGAIGALVVPYAGLDGDSHNQLGANG
jgi:hypothetical protein